MPTEIVDGLTFIFPQGWHVSKFDEWNFYRRQFATLQDGIKAVDLLAISPDQVVFLIEAKDYRNRRRNKLTPVLTEFRQKVLSTLSAILPARWNAGDQEKEFAERVVAARQLRLVLHFEQSRPNRLFPPIIDMADMKQKLRSNLKPIDRRAMVVNQDLMRALPWWSVV